MFSNPSFLAVLTLVRAPAGLTALSNIIASSVIVSAGQLSLSVTWLLVASLCFYFSGMTLNDCFDVREDTQERPNRPIPSGKVSLPSAWTIGGGLMTAGLMLSFMHGTVSGVIGIALSACILCYNGLIKQGLFGSFCMASCRYTNWLLGASFVALSSQSLLLALPIFFYITGLTYLSKQETRATDKDALWITLIALFVSFMSCVYLIEVEFNLLGTQRLIAWLLLLSWATLLVRKLAQVFLSFTPQTIQSMIVFLVIGVIPMDALLVAIAGHYTYALLILSLLPPCLWLNKRLNAIT